MSNFVQVGSEKNSRKKRLNQWNPVTFKALGVIFSVNVDEIVVLNFQNKLDNIRKLFQSWSKRSLTPFVKITVIKTLAIPKLIYLFMNLPNPRDKFLSDLNSLLYKFLWNGKSDTIKRTGVRPVTFWNGKSDTIKRTGVRPVT